MIFFEARFQQFSQIFLTACLLALFSPAPVLAEDEPIAAVGHGAFFDSKSKQIVPTAEFVAKAQQFYRNKLLSGLSAAKKQEFADFEKRLYDGINPEGQARLLIQQRALDWLVANTAAKEDVRTLGKVNALKYELRWKLPDSADLKQIEKREEYKLNPQFEEKLKLKLPQLSPGSPTLFKATTNKGQDYIDECLAAGVPIPPPIGKLDPAGTSGWKSQGFIPTGIQFIVGTPAEVRTFKSTTPPGMCIALPRYSDSSKATVSLDGVICLGQATSKVCFWDNQMPNPQTQIVEGFPFSSGTLIPIGVPDLAVNPDGLYQAGGFEIAPGAGGICTDCHAGQNPYIVHPETNLEDNNGAPTSLKMGDLGGPPDNLPMFAASRYDPLVAAAWPQNSLSMSPALVPGVCGGCHFNGGPGGAFPHLSTELNGPGGYCQTILTQAIDSTMPPFSPGSEKNNPDVITLKDWCGSPASSGPSNRGDPHLTTTSGINYDFQAGGEFTALRNSSIQFELQTRQTPVSTTFIPGANAYTGLASCVSLNTAAALRVGKRRITYQADPSKPRNEGRMQLRIDDRLVNLPANGINLGGGNRIAKAAAGGGIDLSLADSTRVIITPNFWTSQGYWYLNVEVLYTPAREGTMGTILPSNWLPLAPDGSSFGPAPASLADRHILLNKKFADAWRVTDATSLFSYVAGTSTASFTNREWPPEPGKVCRVPNDTREPPKPMKPEVAKRLCSKIKDKAAFESCVFDLTATGDAGMLQAYLQTLKLRQDAVNAGP